MNSPNAIYPQSIKKATGECTIAITDENSQGNSYEINLTSKNIANTSIQYNGFCSGSVGQVLSYTASVNSKLYKRACYVEANATYTLSWKINTPKMEGNRNIFVVTHDETIISVSSYSNAGGVREVTITPTQSGWLYPVFDANATEIQIEKSATSTTYEDPWQIELCQIDNLQDYIYKKNGDWFVHKEIYKVTLAGNETWYGGNAGTTSTDYTYFYTNILDSVSKNEFYHGFCDYATCMSGTYLLGSSSVSKDTFSASLPSTGTSYLRFMIKTSSLPSADLQGCKDWVTRNHPTIYFAVKEPQEQRINIPALVDQLNEIYFDGQSYYDETNIQSSGDDLAPILTAEALQKI